MSKTLTEGTPWRVILVFGTPLLIGNIVQQLYQVVDAMVVGRNLGVNALAAVGTTGAIMFLLIGFAMGLTTGFAIPTAQAHGARDDRAVRSSVAAGTILTALSALVITVIGVLGARPLLQLMQTPAILLDEATTFAVVSLSGAVAIMFFNYLSAILRARGDSTTPLIFLLIASVANMGLVIWFVRYLHLGVGGAALATVVAQLFSVLLTAIYIGKKVPVLKIGLADLRAAGPDLRPLLRLGLPMGFQASIIAIGALAVQIRLNTLGPQAVAAYTTALRVDGLAVAFLMALGLATSTYVAQNYGAKKYDRLKTGVRQSQIMGVIASLVLAAILITFGPNLIRLFVGDSSDQVVTMGHQLLIVTGSFYIMLANLLVTRGALQGIGRMMAPTMSGFVELGIRIVSAVFLGGIFGYAGIIWSGPLAWLGAAALLVPSWIKARERLGARSDKQKAEANETSEPGVPCEQVETHEAVSPQSQLAELGDGAVEADLV